MYKLSGILRGNKIENGCVAVCGSQHTLSRIVSLLRAISLIVPQETNLNLRGWLTILQKVSLPLWKKLPQRYPILILRCLRPAHTPYPVVLFLRFSLCPLFQLARKGVERCYHKNIMPALAVYFGSLHNGYRKREPRAKCLSLLLNHRRSRYLIRAFHKFQLFPNPQYHHKGA